MPSTAAPGCAWLRLLARAHPPRIDNATLTSLVLEEDSIGWDIKNLVEDRLRVNKLVPKVALWVASMANRVGPCDNALPPGVAAHAAVLVVAMSHGRYSCGQHTGAPVMYVNEC